MLSDTITDKLIGFKLRGFLEAYREQQDSSQYRDLSFEERFAMLVDKAQPRHYGANRGWEDLSRLCSRV